MRPGSNELSMRFWSLPCTRTAAFVAPAAGNHHPARRSPSRLMKLTSSYVDWTYAGVFFNGSRVTRVTPSAYFQEMPRYPSTKAMTNTTATRNAQRTGSL